MGCTASKDNIKSAYNRLSQYQLASLEESRGLKVVPVPLEIEEDVNSEHIISARQFHNLFYDGFYAPYMSNPEYLLLLDVRDENSFLERHILSARWHGTVHLDDDLLKRFILIILYDQDGKSLTTAESTMHNIRQRLKEKKIDPLCIDGGIAAVEKLLPYLVTSHILGVPERQLALSWYPSIILEDSLWLGRMEQGTNATILLNLSLTHLIHIGQTGPAIAIPGMTCLTVPWDDTLKGQELYGAVKKAAAFTSKAVQEGGRMLILGDQGVNRSATVVMAFLMQEKICTLEDAFYYVKSLRPATQPSPLHLDMLSKLEVELFGKKITAVEDLW